MHARSTVARLVKELHVSTVITGPAASQVTEHSPPSTVLELLTLDVVSSYIDEAVGKETSTASTGPLLGPSILWLTCG